MTYGLKNAWRKNRPKNLTYYISISNGVWVTSCKHGKTACLCACHVCIHTVSTYITYVCKRNERLRPVPTPSWRPASLYGPDFRTQREAVRRPLRLVQVGLRVRACVRVTQRERERRRRSASQAERRTGKARGGRERERERAQVWTRGEREQRPSGSARLGDGLHGKYKYMLARERTALN